MNLVERFFLFEKIFDMLDVDIYVRLWTKDDDDTFLSFLLGGIPEEIKFKLDYNVWANIMITTGSAVKVWEETIQKCLNQK